MVYRAMDWLKEERRKEQRELFDVINLMEEGEIVEVADSKEGLCSAERFGDFRDNALERPHQCHQWGLRRGAVL